MLRSRLGKKFLLCIIPSMSFFKVNHKSSKSGSRARVGLIQTAHGTVQTPAFVSVGTKGTLKGITPSQAASVGVQMSFVNSYHLVTHPGSEIIKSHGGIHRYSGMNWPLMSDSGGFQLFSLADRARRGKFRDGEESILVSLKEDKVVFRSVYDGKLIEFSPELSMRYQADIGADICMAFDECVYYGATEQYAKKSLNMTHSWLARSIDAMKKEKRVDYEQYLYGVIQGATFENLRVESAKYVIAQNTPGVAIGGVSVGESKQEMREQVAWVAPHLPEDRPVHLLGVGHLDDILDLVAHGIDTFDCVEATRLARLGVLLDIRGFDKEVSNWMFEKLNILDLQYRADKTTLFMPEEAMRLGPEFSLFTRSYLHHLFKQKELLGYTIATMHNLAVMERVMERIREEIGVGRI